MIFTIKLSGEALMVIGAGLDLLPHGKAAPVVRVIQAQISEIERTAKAEREAAATAEVSKLKPKRARRKEGT